MITWDVVVRKVKKIMRLKELFELSQLNPPCLVYQYRCNECIFGNLDKNKCMLNASFDEYKEWIKGNDTLTI